MKFTETNRQVAGANLGRTRIAARATLALAVVVAISSGLVAVSGGIASATTTAFTWTGTDAVNSGNSNFSDPANWSGDAAPQSGTSADLTFPVLDCSSSCGNQPNNDVTGLKVKTFSLALGDENGEGDYSVSGNAIKIAALDVTSTVANEDNGQNAYIGLPMTLQGAESWSVDIENNTNLNLSTVTGAAADSLSVALPISTSGNFGGFINFPSINTGPLSFTGSGGGTTYVTGAAFNSTTKEPVTFKNAGLFVVGPGGTTKQTTTTDYGPLTFTNASVQFGNGGTSGPYGYNSIAGALSFNKKSSVAFNGLTPGTGSKPTGGVDYPQVAASGSVTLGSANLTLYAACNQTVGTKYTLVTGSSISGTFNGLPNDTVFTPGTDGGNPSCQTEGAVTPTLEIKYTSTAVTVTVVAASDSVRQISNRSVTGPLLHESAGRYARTDRSAVAAHPGLKVKSGSEWSTSWSGQCEVDTFDSTDHTFVSDIDGDSGTWSGGGKTLDMEWTAGANEGLKFKGTYTKATDPYYSGKFKLYGSSQGTGLVEEGALSGC